MALATAAALVRLLSAVCILTHLWLFSRRQSRRRLPAAVLAAATAIATAVAADSTTNTRITGEASGGALRTRAIPRAVGNVADARAERSIMQRAAAAALVRLLRRR